MMIAFPICQWSNDAVFIMDFMNGTLPAPVTFTRASSGWYFNSSGNLVSASTNVARFDYGSPGSTTLNGLLIESASTNKVIQCRDATQTAWVKVTMTTALSQTGIDGSANSASLLTASSSAATILQTVTQAATNSIFSVYLKRVTGTGTVQITQDGGVSYTTVTLTSSWQRFNHTAQSTLNPIFGVKISTSGDAVAMDCAQFEAGGLVTSPILTTTAAVTRALDVAVVSSIPWFNATTGSIQTESMLSWSSGAANNAATIDFNDNSTSNQIAIFCTSSAVVAGSFTVAGSSFISGESLGSASANTPFKQGIKYKSGSNVAAYNGSIDTAGTFGGSSLPTGISKLYIGDRSDGARTLNGWVRRFRYWNYGLTNAQLQRMTT